ncbi:type III-A CRISPR-associated protein Csm2 [Chlorobaculum thiosulfatiphilum]|uniref:CRISPR system Cms protein Csm2 n=1 Tax=Chlorobaculum thiosulfatiphilum TaxID=115852 RepID=A0A5C4SAL2_CHLTI|nr:type III-A CRISPR-associated protein Csm2 [Chlorobaculum thiosulfatiphilum]TNJ40312.1 type III-A CRISPR-associated protein Csm2 [Chlorobaculum thiosulfatiphilum]
MQNKPNQKWNEDFADHKLKKAFCDEYVDYLLKTDRSAYNDYITKIKEYVSGIRNNITSSQLRNVYLRVKKAGNCEELLLLRPKIAYVGGRSDSYDMKTFVFLLDRLIENLDDNKEKMKQFQSFFEAVIAYHKYYGGKE